jgi:hypothetical protein
MASLVRAKAVTMATIIRPITVTSVSRPVVVTACCKMASAAMMATTLRLMIACPTAPWRFAVTTWFGRGLSAATMATVTSRMLVPTTARKPVVVMGFGATI